MGRAATIADARIQRKSAGAHYTPTPLATFVAEHLISSWTGKGHPAVLDPSVGDGELLIALVRALDNCARFPSEITGYDTDSEAIRAAKQRLERVARVSALRLAQQDFLSLVEGSAHSDSASLFSTPDLPQFDLVIANPPYVRTQVLGARASQRIASSFGLTGRLDLSFAFLLGIARVLRPGGVAGVIVSNRFMTTKAGSVVRRCLREQFDVLGVWDLGDTRLFEAAVLPAVLLLRRPIGATVKADVPFTTIYSTKETNGGALCGDLLTTLNTPGHVRLSDGRSFEVRHGSLHLESSSEAVWRLTSGETDGWLATVDARTYCRFGELGRIRVGVKTTADNVFIRTDWVDFPRNTCPELLRPLTTHHIAARYRALPVASQILYPHERAQGKRVAVDLALYPKTASYLAQHRDQLEGRTYVIEAGRKWFELWVPQDPDAWNNPKLVFRDISERPVFWVDLDGTVVNGDCYWMLALPKWSPDMLWLALAVANSTFAEAFYDHKFNNRLYAGRRRFMTQYVEQFPVPDPQSSLARELVASAKAMYKNGVTPQGERAMDRLVWHAFGLPFEERSR